MKVYISVDIEGVAGITHWDEAAKTHPDYAEFRELMTKEAIAACEGAKAAGATEILVKDAHDSGRNLILEQLPADVQVVRSWAGHPLCMVQELDASFAGVVMIGYHAAAGSEANALAHTLSLQAARIGINGEPASEFLVHAYAAALHEVPVVLVSGDQGLCEEVERTNPRIGRVAVKRGVGQSTVSLHPAAARDRIRTGVAEALAGDRRGMRLKLPKAFVLEIAYNDPVTAYRMSHYPGARHVGDRTIRFETRDYFEVLRMLQFVT